MVKKKKTEQEVATVAEPVAIEETGTEDNIRKTLEEVRNYEGVVGYILRNPASAAIDLKDPAKIIDYAILSSATFDASQKYAELFDLGDVRSILVEGKDTKMLSAAIDENRISVFMEKSADTEKILRRLRAS